MSWGLLAAKENSSLTLLGMHDSEKQKEILKSITDPLLLNDLLEYHLIDKENIATSKLILESGATPDFVCKGIGSYHFQLVQCSTNFLDPNYLVNEPLVIQTYKACANKRDWLTFHDQANLLINHNVNLDVADKYDVPFYKLIVKEVEPSVKNQNSDENTQLKNLVLISVLSDIVSGNLALTEDYYNQHKEVFSKVAKEIVGRKIEANLQKASDYSSFKKVLCANA